MDSDKFEVMLRLKRPKLGLETDYKNSRSAAIKLFCLSCMGGSKSDVKTCQSFSCPLWQFRPGSIRGMKPPGIIEESKYEEMISANTSDARREHGKKLGESRRKKNVQ